MYAIVAVIILGAFVVPAASAQGPVFDPSMGGTGGGPASPGGRARFARVCDDVSGANARCHAEVRTDIAPLAQTRGLRPDQIAGYTPANLQSAYVLPGSTNGAGQTVALVDAYDDPDAASNVATYRSEFGLATLNTYSSKAASPWFRKVNETGGTSYPRGNSSWGEEISLDLDMVSAICPKCNILLVEASSNSFVDLGTAVNEAAKLGANAISNSYGASEFSGETSYDSYYNHPGVAVTVSSGDGGYGVQWPAASGHVTAVGGTSLVAASGTTRGWSETAWVDAGSGCSKYEAKPSWQADAGCAKRTVADVSAVADPNTGVAVYDTYGAYGWMEFGGTSVSSPIIASVYALAGNASSINYGSFPYSAPKGDLFDVIGGSNGSCGSSTSSTYYLCTAVAGYDGPTGLGTPDTAAGF
jgi:subtilase family serine protease